MSKIIVSIDSINFGDDMDEVSEREDLLESMGFVRGAPSDDGSSYRVLYSIETEDLIANLSNPAPPKENKEE